MNTNIFLPIFNQNLYLSENCKYEYQHIFTNFNQIYLNIYSSKVIQIGFVFIWQGDNVFILLTRSCLVCKQDHKHRTLQNKTD